MAVLFSVDQFPINAHVALIRDVTVNQASGWQEHISRGRMGRVLEVHLEEGFLVARFLGDSGPNGDGTFGCAILTLRFNDAGCGTEDHLSVDELELVANPGKFPPGAYEYGEFPTAFPGRELRLPLTTDPELPWDLQHRRCPCCGGPC